MVFAPLSPSQWRRAVWLCLGGILALALFLRLGAVGRTWLEYDDYFHLLVADTPTLWAAYREALPHSHPPLGLLVNHLLWRIWNEELFLRVVSALAGTLALIPAFGFWRRLFGPREALLGTLLLGLSPLAVMLSGEMRTYALLMALHFSALHALVRRRWAFYFGLTFLSLTVHYCSLLFVAAVGVAVGVRMLAAADRQALARWVQAHLLLGLGAVAVGLPYFLRTWRTFHEPLATGSFSGFVWRPARETAAEFLLRSEEAFFSAILPGRWFWPWLLVLGLAALLVFRRGARRHGGGPERLQWATAVAFPLVLAATLALCRLYPLNGMRHCLYLIPFVITGVLPVLARLVPNRAAVPATLALVAAGALWSAPRAASHWGNWPSTLWERQETRRARAFAREHLGERAVTVLDRQDVPRARYYFVGATGKRRHHIRCKQSLEECLSRKNRWLFRRGPVRAFPHRRVHGFGPLTLVEPIAGAQPERNPRTAFR